MLESGNFGFDVTGEDFATDLLAPLQQEFLDDKLADGGAFLLFARVPHDFVQFFAGKFDCDPHFRSLPCIIYRVDISAQRWYSVGGTSYTSPDPCNSSLRKLMPLRLPNVDRHRTREMGQGSDGRIGQAEGREHL